MKKYVFSGFMAGMLIATSAAFAEGEAAPLTTKNYVDDGLRAVYNVAKDASDTATAAAGTATAASSAATAASSAATAASNKVDALETTIGDSTGGIIKDIDDLQTAVGNANAGLVKDVADLQTVVGDSGSGLVKKVNDLEAGVTYTGGVGISVDSSNQVGLDGLTGATDNKNYVFRNGAWVELPVVNTWDPSILTTVP